MADSTFNDFSSAWKRSCDNQKNKCGDFANSDAGRAQGLKVSACEDQLCKLFFSSSHFFNLYSGSEAMLLRDWF